MTAIVQQKSTSIEVITLILNALGPVLAAIAAFFARSAVAGVKEVHLAINSRLDQWLLLERKQGVETGRQQERDDAAKIK